MMEVRRAAELLLRTNTSPITSFLAPSSTIRWTQKCQLTPQRTCSRPLLRTFTTSPQSKATRPPTTTSAATQIDPLKSKADTTSPPEDISQLSNSLWGNTASRNSSIRPKSTSNSAADMLSMLDGYKPKSRTDSIDFGRMQTPQTAEERELIKSIDIVGLSSEMEAHSLSAAPLVPKPKMRLNPTTGRTVPVLGNTDVAKAFKLLDISCARNKVRMDQNRQRFHERGGLKRKRLARERWRRRFGEGFKAVVMRVKHLRRQGW